MKQQFLTQASLLFLTLLLSQYLPGQDLHPTQGQPQGGDRRGAYLNDPDESDEIYEKSRQINRLYPDPKIYLHNMTLLAHIPEGGGEMMTIGANRYLVGDGVIVDVTDPKNPVVVNDKAPGGELAYNQALKKWILMRPTSCCFVSPSVMKGEKPPLSETDLPKLPFGVTFYDVTDPRNPVELSSWRTEPGIGMLGTHGDGNYYDGGKYAYLSAYAPGVRGQMPFQVSGRILRILDVSDIKNPKEISRWWVPGQMKTEETAFLRWPQAQDWNESNTYDPDKNYYYFADLHGPCLPPKRVEDGGNRAYCSWGANGMRILDFSDILHPKQVSELRTSPPFNGGIPVHTVYPMLQRKLAFINPETIRWDCNEEVTFPWVVDLRSEKYPMAIASFPIPKPPAEAPYNDFCFRGGRFGTHMPNNFKAPGEMRADLIGYAWFQGGFRLYDVSNPFRPEEVAWMVPAQGKGRGTEGGLIEWDRKIIHVFTDTGLYILSSPALGEPVLGPLKPERWNPEGLNAEAP